MPINEKLTELTLHRTSLTDVIGGLGYIMGIFGLWAYSQSKKRKDSRASRNLFPGATR